jgi:CheY-like chemotaxis protein/HPt (histidine-containing phosphotransfer) domain-containing protein
MGGEITVESVLGSGSIFRFELPLDEASSDAKPVNLYDPKRDISDVELPTNISILAVDDHPVNQKFIEKLFVRLGFYNVDMANNGRQALEMIDANPYDIVFMDCQMPELDGYQATMQLRQQESNRGGHRLPVIALTANAMVGDRDKCIKSGMDDYLSKPIRPEKLIELIKIYTKGQAEQQTTPIIHVEPKRSGAIPPVDMERLNLFTDGDPQEEKELLDLFFQQAELSVAELEINCDEENNENWKHAAHRIKGSSANLGATILAKVCEKAEKNYNAETASKQAMLAQIKIKLNDIKDFFDAK